MPTISVNKKMFEKLVGKELPVEKLKDRISYLGTDLEGIENDEISVEIFPNRPDMLSAQGFARAFSSFIGVKTGLKQYKVEDSGEEVIIDKSVNKVRPYTACAIVKGIKYDDEKIKEVIQLQEKLHVTYGRNRRKVAIGIYPYEKIKPPIYFVARKPEEIRFRPLEFPRELNGLQILSQHPVGREYGYLLEGVKTFPIFIDSNNKILSMPPIINSHDTGKIAEETKDIFIECSGFDFNVLQKCLNIIVTALADMGGRIYSMKLRYPDKTVKTPDLRPFEMRLEVAYINKILDSEFSEKGMIKLLERMGYGYKNKKVLVPAYRTDVLHQVDLAEDIAIAYGFENFKSIIPNMATIGEEDSFEVFKNKITQVLVGLGMLETNTYNITNKEFQTRCMETKLPLVELRNSLSAEYTVLRYWMIPSLLEILKNNKHYDYPQNIFGFGTVFKKNIKEETNIQEDDVLVIMLCHKKADYTEIKQVLDYLFRSIGIVYKVQATKHDSFISGRIAEVIIKDGKNRSVAFMGEIHPKVLENFGLEMPVAALELNLSDLFDIINKELK